MADQAFQLEQLQPPEYTLWLEAVHAEFVAKFGEEQAVSMAEKYYYKKYLMPIEIYNAGYAAARAAAEAAAAAAPVVPAAPAFVLEEDLLRSVASTSASSGSQRPIEPAVPPTPAWAAPAAPAVDPPLPPPVGTPPNRWDSENWSNNDWRWKDDSAGSSHGGWEESKQGWSDDGWRSSKRQRKEPKELPTDPEEYKKLAFSKAVDWYTARNRTGWLNKCAPLVYHLLKETDADYEVALKVAAEYSEDKLMESLIHLYGRHLKD